MSTPLLASPGDGYLGGTIHGGKDTVIGEIDLFLPFHVTGDRLFYLAPKFSQADEGITNGGVGVGVRQLIADTDFVLGGALFYDSLWSRRDEQYNQGGLYVEALHPWFQLRGNYYLPESDENAFATRTSEIFGSGNQILQDTEKRFEAALEGWDVSLGRAIVLPEVPGQFYVEGSYRRYSNPFGSSIGGAGATAEYAPVSFVRVGAHYHEDRDFIGARWFGSVRVEIPLGQQTRDLRGGNGSRALMYAQVRRSTRVITSESGWVENPDGTSNVLVNNVLFVDNDAGSPLGDGTFENPFDEIQGAASDALGGEMVYLNPTATAYSGNVVLQESIHLVGNNPFGLFGSPSGVNSLIDIDASGGAGIQYTSMVGSNGNYVIEGVDFVGTSFAAVTFDVFGGDTSSVVLRSINSDNFMTFEANDAGTVLTVVIENSTLPSAPSTEFIGGGGGVTNFELINVDFGSGPITESGEADGSTETYP